MCGLSVASAGMYCTLRTATVPSTSLFTGISRTCRPPSVASTNLAFTQACPGPPGLLAQRTHGTMPSRFSARSLVRR